MTQEHKSCTHHSYRLCVSIEIYGLMFSNEAEHIYRGSTSGATWLQTYYRGLCSIHWKRHWLDSLFHLSCWWVDKRQWMETTSDGPARGVKRWSKANKVGGIRYETNSVTVHLKTGEFMDVCAYAHIHMCAYA